MEKFFLTESIREHEIDAGEFENYIEIGVGRSFKHPPVDDEGIVDFSDLKINETPISACELLMESREYRLYVNKDDHSFIAMAVRFCECYSKDNFWECPKLRVEVLFTINGYARSINHFEIKRDTDDPGYIYCPNMKSFIKMFDAVDNLAKEMWGDDYAW